MRLSCPTRMAEEARLTRQGAAEKIERTLSHLEALTVLPVVLLLAAFASHVLPHPWWNFTAVGGALLVWGARTPLRWIVFPVVLLGAGDWILTTVVYGYTFHASAYALTWAWYAMTILLGRWLLRGRPGFARVAGSAALASVTFFLASNFAVWAMAGSWYPHTWAGLASCYTLAIPFFRNDLFSTLLVVGVVWGLPPLARRLRNDGAEAGLLRHG